MNSLHARHQFLLTILLSVSSPPVTGLGAVRKGKEKQKDKKTMLLIEK